MTDIQSKTGLKRKHVTLTICNKLKVIEQIELGIPGKLIAAEFGISRQTVSDIKKRTDAIKAYAQKYDVSSVRRKTLKKPKEEMLESSLYKWYTRQCANGVAVDTSDLQAAAGKLAQQLGIEFTCNAGWICRFRYRHNIKRRSSEPDNVQKSEPSSSRENVEDEGESEIEKDEEMLPLDCVVKEETQMWPNEFVDMEQPPESSALNAARDGIEAVLNFVGVTSNRQLWAYYEQLRSIKEIIIHEQRKMTEQTVSGSFLKSEFDSKNIDSSESVTDELD